MAKKNSPVYDTQRIVVYEGVIPGMPDICPRSGQDCVKIEMIDRTMVRSVCSDRIACLGHNPQVTAEANGARLRSPLIFTVPSRFELE